MNIVVTGASRGIGFEIVSALSQNPDHHIVAISRDEDGLHRLLDIAGRQGNANVTICKLDISNINEVDLQSVIAPLGHIDILINNAGLLINKPFPQLTLNDWRSIFEVNLFGAVAITSLLLPYLRKSSMAHIVNIGGMGGLQGTSKFHGLSAYSASKAALANLTECLAEELKADSIRVNCLALGSVNTEMLKEAFPDFKAPVNADEMARFIIDFSLNAARLINGKIIPVSVNTP